ncbi:MAG: zinc-ribbon domain-containing protein [Nitrospirae bacterium]|nr:zinc-ribbon domain-containing protein [Nitrospirota bacterium]
MVVTCPRCKTRLKIDESKIKAEGSRFKCPKCSTPLFIKKPAPITEKAPDNKKIIIAHSNPDIINEIQSILSNKGYQVITSSDGIDTMVKTLKELPFAVIIEAALPKIYGFEVCNRLKSRAETKNIKFILVSSIYDKVRYKREPTSLYEADDFIDEHKLSEALLDKINALREKKPAEKEKHIEKPEEKVISEKVEKKPEPARRQLVEDVKPDIDDKVERAKRLARTIISDIYLYNTPRFDNSIKNGTFYSEFSNEIKDGMKLYESRIPEEVRKKGDFFHEVIREFIESKKNYN